MFINFNARRADPLPVQCSVLFITCHIMAMAWEQVAPCGAQAKVPWQQLWLRCRPDYCPVGVHTVQYFIISLSSRRAKRSSGSEEQTISFIFFSGHGTTNSNKIL